VAQIDFYFKCIFASQKQLVPVALRKPKCFAGNTPDRSGVIVPGTAMEEAPDTPPEKKPKRSGKPKPLEDRINFQVYFQRWLAEKGITYRSWISQHRRQHIWVYLGRLTVKGLEYFTILATVV